MEKKLENNLKDSMLKETELFNKKYDSTSCSSNLLKENAYPEIKVVCGKIFKP